jgi:hypothetical protein
VLTREVPVLEQFGSMQIMPFQNVTEGALGKRTVHNAVQDAHRDRVLAVRRVKVRRIVLAVEDRDDDAEKATDFRHAPEFTPCTPNDIEFSGEKEGAPATDDESAAMRC